MLWLLLCGRILYSKIAFSMTLLRKRFPFQISWIFFISLSEFYCRKAITVLGFIKRNSVMSSSVIFLRIFYFTYQYIYFCMGQICELHDLHHTIVNNVKIQIYIGKQFSSNILRTKIKTIIIYLKCSYLIKYI